MTDDVAVAGAEVEYAVGDHGPPVRLPVPLAGLGTPRAAGRFTFDLTGKGAEGETVRVRVRATDAAGWTTRSSARRRRFTPRPGGWSCG